MLAKTAAQFGVRLAQQSDQDFIIVGNLDLLMDFRRAFDREVLACGTGSSGSVEEGLTTPNHALSEQHGGASASAAGDTASAQPPSFPSSMFDSQRGLNSDALTILEKIPEGRIPGIQYAPGEGVVYIRKDMRDRDGGISKFQKAYQGLLLGKKMKVEVVDLPVECSEAAVTGILEEFLTRYPNCDFSLMKDYWGVKIISNSSRQFETAKKLLLDQLSCLPSYTISLPGGRVLTLKRGDIVAESVDVIVNAANGSLLHAGGVALAINKASGGAVQQHSKAFMKNRRKDLTVGSVAVTKAGGSLRCKQVLHAVGPTSNHSDCAGALNFLMRNILNEVKKHNIRSIAIPAISSGIFGVDKNLVAQCIVDTLTQYTNYPKNPSLLSDIRVVIIDQPTYQCFVSYVQKKGLLPPPPMTTKKKSSASRLESSTEKDDGSGSGAKGTDDKKAGTKDDSSEGS